MQLFFLLVTFAGQIVEGPEPEDVKAGWTAFAIFLLLCGAVVFLMFSLTKQLRRAQAAKEAGVYGEAVEPDEHLSGPRSD